ncbi:MAG: electron transfer flavoprotein subunit beta/FixA family protein [Acidilobaceae archaeon]
MPLRNIIVTLKITPKPEEIRFDPVTKTIDRAKATNEINPADKNALEMALQLREKYGGRVITVSMGPPVWEPLIKLAVAMGADDAILISDRALAGSDTLPTSLTLARAIAKIGDYDIILSGEESSDGGTGQVPPGIGEWLRIPHVTYVSAIEIIEEGRARIKRTIKGGYEILEVKMPFIASVELGCNTPRFPDFRRKRWAEREFKLKVWTIADLELAPEEVGFKGSATTVVELRELKPPERLKRVISGDPDKLAEELAEIIRSIIR